jgi:hypothetical protein
MLAYLIGRTSKVAREASSGGPVHSVVGSYGHFAQLDIGAWNLRAKERVAVDRDRLGRNVRSTCSAAATSDKSVSE